nr:immunoglobulin heavy chain junction region [Mus musculus]
CARLSYYFDYW